jgi:hypothetical protein
VVLRAGIADALALPKRRGKGRARTMSTRERPQTANAVG